MVLDQRKNGLWFGHGGDTQGFLNDAVISVAGDGLVVTTNSDWSKGLIAAVQARAASLYDWPASPFPFPANRPGSKEEPIPVPTGRFGTADGLEIWLHTGDDNGLHLELTGQAEPIVFTHAGGQQWRSHILNTLLTWHEPDQITITQTMQHGPVPPLIANRAA